MSIQLYLQIGILIALVIIIVYLIILDNHLLSARKNYKMLSQLMAQFYGAADKTQNDLIELKKAQELSRQDLQADIHQARLLQDELNKTVERFEKKSFLTFAKSIKNTFSTPKAPQFLSESDKDLKEAVGDIK